MSISGLREGSISGVVWDASMAKPLAEVSLMLVGGSGRLNATTDANGAFKFPGLKPSDYRLVAGGSFGEMLGTKAIALKSGEELTGAYRTRGLLQYEPQAFAGTDAQGRYSLRGVRPGSSYLRAAIHLDASKAGQKPRGNRLRSISRFSMILAFRQPASGEAALAGSAVIPAGDEDITGLRIAAQSGLTLTGQVVWETGTPAGPITDNLSVEFTPVNRSPLPFETGIRFKAPLLPSDI